MFEKFTEKARRVIFFARYEASQLGAQAIEAEHILLGLLRDDKELTQRLFADAGHAVESIRKNIEGRAPYRNKISASVDLPLSESAKQVLYHAASESQRLKHRHIGTEHLLLGLIKQEGSPAALLLGEHGVSADTVAAKIVDDSAVLSESRPTVGGIVGGVAGGIHASMSLAPQINLLTKILMARGIITPQDFSGGFDWRVGHMKFEALLELLVGKGVISEADRQEIMKLGE